MAKPAAKNEFRPALLFLLPNILGFLAFTAGPVLGSLVLSFTSWNLLSPPRWAGMTNYVDLLGFHQAATGWSANDPGFWRYLGNTFYLLLGLPINMAGALGLALLLNQKLRFTYVYRLVFFLPSILAGVAIYYLWKFMYNPEFGLFNTVLRACGLPGLKWLSDPSLAKPCLMIMSFWIGVGGTSMVLFLAALQNVPVELVEAAKMDGANHWQRFRHITWPSLAPVTFFILTIGLIQGLQSGFDAAYIMTDGGPYGTTKTVGFYIYENAYRLFQMGYASAIAWVLFALVLTITLLNWKRGVKNLAV